MIWRSVVQVHPPLFSDETTAIRRRYWGRTLFTNGLSFDRPIEAGAIASVTRSAILSVSIEQRIVIAVDANLFDPLDVTARLALLPELVATSGVKVSGPSVLRLCKRFRGNVREHQSLIRLGVLCNRGNRYIFTDVEFDVETCVLRIHTIRQTRDTGCYLESRRSWLH